MTSEPMHTASKKEMVPHSPVINYSLKMKYPLCFVVSYVQPVTQQYESRAARKAPLQIKIATMKNMDDFHFKGKASLATTKSTTFAVSKDEWDTKEDTGK